MNNISPLASAVLLSLSATFSGAANAVGDGNTTLDEVIRYDHPVNEESLTAIQKYLRPLQLLQRQIAKENDGASQDTPFAEKVRDLHSKAYRNVKNQEPFGTGPEGSVKITYNGKYTYEFPYDCDLSFFSIAKKEGEPFKVKTEPSLRNYSGFHSFISGYNPGNNQIEKEAREAANNLTTGQDVPMTATAALVFTQHIFKMDGQNSHHAVPFEITEEVREKLCKPQEEKLNDLINNDPRF